MRPNHATVWSSSSKASMARSPGPCAACNPRPVSTGRGPTCTRPPRNPTPHVPPSWTRRAPAQGQSRHYGKYISPAGSTCSGRELMIVRSRIPSVPIIRSIPFPCSSAGHPLLLAIDGCCSLLLQLMRDYLAAPLLLVGLVNSLTHSSIICVFFRHACDVQN